MRLIKSAVVASLVAFPVMAAAQSAEVAIEARQGYMELLAINMGQLSGMAKGDIAYDEGAASTAAANIATLTNYTVPSLFVAGSADGEAEESRALPAIWQKPEEFAQRFASLREAATGAPEAVMGGQANVGPALQKLGGACKACHDDFRKPE
ncbi:c-type cytochrome [Paracoccus marinaquae]|uniref:Cytochrome c n=1 Tax=Paracoccus marinaquae TaxID=2841926 RepID=A0ABS6AJ16_9RHOB|nr:cytochrome c [Paracoccus marinaquae]MBU3029604.1 cytochrome c [Paracoccus marinaquae]